MKWGGVQEGHNGEQEQSDGQEGASMSRTLEDLGLGEEQGGGGVKILSSAVVSQQKLIDSNQERLSIGQQSVGEILNQDFLKTSPQAKRHKPSLLFTSLTILTFVTR